MKALPDGWRWSSLAEVAAASPGSIVDGPFGSNLKTAHYRAFGARVIRLQNIGDGFFRESDAFIDLEHFEALRKHEVVAGDLVVASLGDNLPRACLIPPDVGPAIVKADCIRVRLSDEVDPKWVMYVLQAPSAKQWASDQLHGVGRQRLGVKAIRSIPIPLPPLEEQQRIVATLDVHLNRLSAANEALARAERLRESHWLATLRWAHRTAMQTGELTPLGEVADTRLGKMLDAARAQGTPTPYLRNQNVQWRAIDFADLLEVPLTTDEVATFDIRRGDILICEGGEPGRAAVVDRLPAGPLAFQKAIHRVRVKGRVKPDFLLTMLEAVVRLSMAAGMLTGTTIKHLPQEKLRAIEIPLPGLATQETIVERVTDTLLTGRRLSASLTAQVDRGSHLRRSLLHGAISGRLTTNRLDIVDV